MITFISMRLSAVICALIGIASFQSSIFASLQSGSEGVRGRGIKLGGEVGALPSAAKRYAIVIGVDNYQDKQITTLGGSSNDARTLADALAKYAGFPQDQVILLASDQPEERQPTRGNILRKISNLRTIVPKDGLLLISFAGHGMEREGRAYLLPSDAQVSGDVVLLEDTAINVTAMKERIRQTGVGQVILVIDACRNDPSGRADAPNPLSETYTRGFSFDTRNRDVTAFATLYASSPGQRAFEFTEKKQGYFTWALVEGLRGGAANDKGEITLANLKKYLEDTVTKRVKLDLGEGKEQKPYTVIEGYKAEDLVISVKVKIETDRSADIEISFWRSIENSKNPEDFKEYLKKYPNGEFAGLANNRLKALDPTAVSTAASTARPVDPASSAGSSSLRTYDFETVVMSSAGKVLKRPKGQARFFIENIGGANLEMVEAPGGDFLMGSSSESQKHHDKNQEPQHQVKLKPFFIGKFEVTQAQWKAVAKLPKVNRDLNPDPSNNKFEDLPVEQITWEDAVEFCARISKQTGKSYRLPTEAEWEYACRAGASTEFAFGENMNIELVNFWPNGKDRSETVPVGSLGVPNAFGIYDMHGNVWEYCLDAWHENYDGAPADGTAWESADVTGFAAARGGSWRCTGVPCRSAYRSKTPMDGKYFDYGFRVVMDAERNAEAAKPAPEFTKELQPRRPIRRKQSSGKIHSYRSALKAGQSYLIELNHEDKEASVSVIGPDGNQVKDAKIEETVYSSFSLSEQGGKKIDVSLPVKINGDYRLEIRPKDNKTFRYELEMK